MPASPLGGRRAASRAGSEEQGRPDGAAASHSLTSRGAASSAGQGGRCSAAGPRGRGSAGFTLPSTGRSENGAAGRGRGPGERQPRRHTPAGSGAGRRLRQPCRSSAGTAASLLNGGVSETSRPRGEGNPSGLFHPGVKLTRVPIRKPWATRTPLYFLIDQTALPQSGSGSTSYSKQGTRPRPPPRPPPSPQPPAPGDAQGSLPGRAVRPPASRRRHRPLPAMHRRLLRRPSPGPGRVGAAPCTAVRQPPARWPRCFRGRQGRSAGGRARVGWGECARVCLRAQRRQAAGRRGQKGGHRQDHPHGSFQHVPPRGRPWHGPDGPRVLPTGATGTRGHRPGLGVRQSRAAARGARQSEARGHQAQGLGPGINRGQVGVRPPAPPLSPTHPPTRPCAGSGRGLPGKRARTPGSARPWNPLGASSVPGDGALRCRRKRWAGRLFDVFP